LAGLRAGGSTAHTVSARAFLFDLDGTLLDSIGLDRRCFQHAFETVGRAVPDDDAFLRGLGIPLVTVLRGWAASEEQACAMLDAYRAYSREHHDRHVRAFDGAVETVRALRSRGDRVAVVTSKSRVAAQRGIRFLGLVEEVEVLVAPEDVPLHKPDPYPFLHGAERLGIPVESAFVIGDSPHDLQAGRAAAMTTVAALWGPFPREALEPHAPDHWFTHPRELLDL